MVYTAVLLTLINRHLLWDVWCSSTCSMLRHSFRTIFLLWMKLLQSYPWFLWSQDLILRMYCPQWGSSRFHSAEVGQDPSSWKQVNSWGPRGVLQTSASLTRCIHFGRTRHNAVCCQHTVSSAGHLPHVLGNVKPVLWRCYWWYGIV